MSWSVKLVEHDGYPCITAEGYIDQRGGEDLKKMAENMQKLGKREVIFDFSECKLISSPGLADLLDFVLVFVEDNGGRVMLVTTAKSLIDVFRMVRLAQFATIVPSREAAVKEIRFPSS